jgi:hypothetical protein
MIERHLNNSFSYKVINKNIKNALISRSVLNNTAQLSMPFVKATTTIQLPDILGEGNIGFTLGTHMTELDMRWQDLLTSPSGGYPLLGYTYRADNKNQPIYAFPLEGQEEILRILDVGADLVTEFGNYGRVPPPGITSVDIGVYKSGYNRSAIINFTVPSLLQLEVLHRVFLIPGMGMVLEWGQQFASEPAPAYGEVGLSANKIDQHMFPWYNRDAILGDGKLLERLGSKLVGMDEIMEDYVYPTQGQYMWMYGNVGNFSVKAQTNGSFACSVRIIGPAEGQHAFAVRNTTVPPRDKSGRVCINNETSIETYFTSTTAGSLNFISLLEGVYNGAIPELVDWKDHVIFFEKGNVVNDGESSPGEPSNPQASEEAMGESEDSYFISWRFFVNVVLNDDRRGVKAIFKRAALLPHELNSIGLLRPYNNDVSGSIFQTHIDDEYENFVGNNMYLRSVDPSVLIIVNDTAARLAAQEYQRLRIDVPDDVHVPTADSKKFDKLGDFYTSGQFVADPPPPPGIIDRGLLSTGVWVNSKAVIRTIAPADTIMSGVQRLLTEMSNATQNFWSLVIDRSEPFAVDPESTINYATMDLNYRESSVGSVEKFLSTDDGVHVFNRFIRDRNDTRIGSELLECAVELSLPQRMFAQIATMGLVQPEDVAIADGEDAEDYPDTPIVSDPNEIFRKMFALTTASTRLADGRSPDLSSPSKLARAELLEKLNCGGTVSGGTTAGAAGQGQSSMPPNSEDTTPPDEKEARKKAASAEVEAADIILMSDGCKECREPTPSPQAPFVPPAGRCSDATGPVGSDAYPAPPDFRGKYQNAKIPLSALVGIEQGALSRYTYNGTSGWFLLHPQAAQAYRQLKSLAESQGIKFTVSSAYRDYAHQSSLKNGAASAGRSAHGWGGAIDIRELNRAARGSTEPAPNRQVRQTNALYKWLAANGPGLGWYNPCRLADNAGTDEVWHWEYWGFSASPPPPPPPPPTPTPVPTTGAVVRDCSACDRARERKARANKILEQLASEAAAVAAKEKIDVKIRQFSHLKTVFRYIEPMPDLMVGNITRTSNGNSSNAFGAAPGSLAITADITLPGINGLRMGELFWIDRIPAFYKAFGAFQIMSIQDTISLDGWTTKIHSRFNYLGVAWKEKMVDILLNGDLASEVDSVEVPASSDIEFSDARDESE